MCSRTMRVKGTVTYLDLEGGFWGILGDDGGRYHPVEPLPSPVRSEGCRVVAELEPANMMSFAMWGKTVRVLQIRQA